MQPGDRILVTGATGFVGSAVARLLDARGLAVRVLARSTSPRRNLEGLNCEVVLGDITDTTAMNRALNGTRFLFHVPANYRLWAPDSREIIRTNLEGTRAVMQAALDQGAERIVYTSSVATPFEIESSSVLAPSRLQTGVLPFLTTYFGPGTECAGIRWRVIFYSREQTKGNQIVQFDVSASKSHHHALRAACVCENPARIARVTKSDRKAQSIVVAPMLAYGRQVSASQEASAVLVPDHYPCIVT